MTILQKTRGTAARTGATGKCVTEPPRDRDGTFEPEVVKKRETILAEGLSDKIIGLYAQGQSTRDISRFIEENYGSSISAETISHITDKVWPEIQSWRNRGLEDVYPIVWLDAIHYKVKDEKGAVVSRAIYNVLGVDRYGFKDLLGMYVSQSEGANFWLGVLTDLKNRGVKDILIACIDGLKGFPDAINAVFPETDVQLCIVHQVRNSLKYVASKNQKEFLADLKLVYQAKALEKAEMELGSLAAKWNEISDCGSFLARELAQPEPLFSVYRGYPPAYLHDQHRRGLPPPCPQGD